jgi:sporulation protein YlmC with PRC-barrel domain
MKSASIVTITSFVLALLLAAPATADEQQTQAQSPAQKPQLEIEKSGSVRPSGSGSVTGHESERVGTGQAQPVGEVAPERTTAAPVEDITGMNVVNTAGDEIGEVDEIVRDKETGKLSAVISVGGFLGIGDKDVAIPLDELQLQGEQLLAPLAGTEEQLKSRPAYEEARYEELPEEQIVQLGPKQGEASGSAMGKGSAAQTLFSALDANSDGYLSKQEASESAVVSEHWNLSIKTRTTASIRPSSPPLRKSVSASCRRPGTSPSRACLVGSRRISNRPIRAVVVAAPVLTKPAAPMRQERGWQG